MLVWAVTIFEKALDDIKTVDTATMTRIDIIFFSFMLVDQLTGELSLTPYKGGLEDCGIPLFIMNRILTTV